MNAIELLKQQHKRILTVLERGCEGELDAREAKRAADELVAHMAIEEHIFYPRVRELMSDLIEESFEEHTVARFALARSLMARGDEQMRARFSVLEELVRNHIEEEELEMLPRVRASLSQGELERLGARMQAMYERAVEAGLESLVTGPTQDLRKPNGGAPSGTRRKVSSHTMRASR